MKDTLTKENFWDEMEQKYPKAMAHFKEWIDRYKKANDWNTIFNSDSDWQDMHGKNAPAPKYHELPIAMQFGIFLEWAYPYQWTEAEKPGGFAATAERGIHHILRWKEGIKHDYIRKLG